MLESWCQRPVPLHLSAVRQAASHREARAFKTGEGGGRVFFFFRNGGVSCTAVTGRWLGQAEEAEEKAEEGNRLSGLEEVR